MRCTSTFTSLKKQQGQPLDFRADFPLIQSRQNPINTPLFLLTKS